MLACVDPAVELLCSVDRMTLRLRTAAPFAGRIFSLDAPTTCDVRGTGQLTTEATFVYQDVSCHCLSSFRT